MANGDFSRSGEVTKRYVTKALTSYINNVYKHLWT